MLKKKNSNGHKSKRKHTNSYKNNTLRDVSAIPSFPIDIVYTFAGEGTSNGQRLRYNGELRYSLRSIYRFTPWAHAIFIVISDDTLYPSWIIPNKTINCTIPLFVIKHSEIYSQLSNAQNNHNSDSIESRLHHIPGLSNHFIYFNDDFFLFQYTSYLFFFNRVGIPRFPSGLYWNYYKDRRKNPILSHPIYPEQNLLKIIEAYPELEGLKIPYRTKKHFAEHMARPYTRTAWFALETHYFRWFQFVESHKQRFCSTSPDQSRIGCLEEIIYILMLTYRLLNWNIRMNDTFKQEIQLIDEGNLYRLVTKKEFEIEIFDYGYSSSKLRMFTDSMIKYRPHSI